MARKRKRANSSSEQKWPAVCILDETDDKYQLQWEGNWLPTWEPKEYAPKALVKEWNARDRRAGTKARGGYFTANRIIKERARHYLVDWCPDEHTGQVYTPSWVKKDDATGKLVADWKQTLAQLNNSTVENSADLSSSAGSHEAGALEKLRRLRQRRASSQSKESASEPVDGMGQESPGTPKNDTQTPNTTKSNEAGGPTDGLIDRVRDSRLDENNNDLGKWHKDDEGPVVVNARLNCRLQPLAYADRPTDLDAAHGSTPSVSRRHHNIKEGGEGEGCR
ncbi:hypothetical protein IWX49DRAFT_386428 [Phyllosticta citricarpa]|uniref:Chromo domain-containing protein n=1 Tax=Phyllosticta paracitricarpa TaxID=2016321 RepID=A0ABR1MUK6_9PEZI